MPVKVEAPAKPEPLPDRAGKSGNLWKRLSTGERVSTVIGMLTLLAALLVIPEVRYFLHLEKRPVEKPSEQVNNNPQENNNGSSDKGPSPEKKRELKLTPLPNTPALPERRELYTRLPRVEANPRKGTVETGGYSDQKVLVTLPEDVSRKLLEVSVRPSYPALARQARIRGNVVLKVHVGPDGVVNKVDVVSGHPILVQDAIQAVKQWRYQPYLYEGKAIPMDTTVTLSFDGKND